MFPSYAESLELAEKFQGPAFILTDHFLADSYRDVDPVDVLNLSSVNAGSAPSFVEKPYLRYRITEGGVSPRLLPGSVNIGSSRIATNIQKTVTLQRTSRFVQRWSTSASEKERGYDRK